MSAAITIADVRKRFPGVYALKGISFTIQRGEFFGLLGPNGAGKSTLINIIAGLTRCDSGSVSVLTHDVVQDYRQARRCLGVVPQELVFDPFFTVHEVLRIQSGYFGLRRENASWIEELMDTLDLSDKADTNMRALSGGMKRRVLIAQALAHKPEVIVLDEPTAGVDVALRKSLWAFIRRLHEEGHTIVLTTHYLEEAESLCGRIAILNHGNVVALDTKEGLLKRGIGKTVNVWITADEPVPELPDELLAILRARDGTRLEFRLDNNLNSIGDLLEGLRRTGLVIADLHTEAPDLEDVFLDLTREREE